MVPHRLSTKTSELKPTACLSIHHFATHYSRLFALPLAVETTIMARLQDVRDEVCLAANFQKIFWSLLSPGASKVHTAFLRRMILV
jgi:hypothetical protein